MNEVRLHLQGVVQVLLVDPTESDVTGVVGDTGLALGGSGEPDVTVRFVEDLRTGPVRMLGVEGGACAAGYLVQPTGNRPPGRTLVPLTEVGGRCELLVERGSPSVPLLIEVLNLTAAQRGLLPLHGAAFVWQDLGWVVTGWSKGGKTETVLGVTARGARFVGDEWVYLAGGQAHGTAHPLRLWDWQLRQRPDVLAGLTRKQRLRLNAVGRALRLHADAGGRRRRLPPYRLLAAAAPALREQHGVYARPQDVFPVADRQPSAPLDRLVLMESSSARSTTSERLDPGLVAERMVASLQYERRDLTDAWTRYRYAEPAAQNLRLDQIADVERRLLHAAFTGVDTFRVDHPYPVELSVLADALNDLV